MSAPTTTRRLLLTLAGLALVAWAPSAMAQTGGPNTFGYEYGPVTYDYVAPPGTATPLAMFDDAVIPVTLPWSFSYYGVGYSTVYVADNGGLRFTSGNVDWQASCLPSGFSAPDIALFWDDLSVDIGGLVYAWHDTSGGADRFVISWEDISLYYGTGANGGTFQVHLHPTGNVELHWTDTDLGDSGYDHGANAVIGIQDVGGVDALQVSCATASTLENTALGFSTCADADADGFQDLACGGTDCDDADPAISPVALEVCEDGVDDDCDGVDGLSDTDGDGWTSALCVGGDDCDDTDPALNPGVDADGDGWDACIDCNESFAFINPGAAEVCGNAIDEDCSGADDLPDVDTDGFTSVACGGDDCDDFDAAVNPSVDVDADGFDACADCDDAEALANPGGTEVCDTLDNDCDGAADNVDADGDGEAPVACGGTDCDDADPNVGAGTDVDSDGFDACLDCDDGDAAIYPGAPEACDTTDSDCDGLVDGLDPDVGAITAPPLTAGPTASSLILYSVTPVTMAVSGATADIYDLDVTVDITIDTAYDLSFTLTSPAGTTITLAQNPGSFSGANFSGTVFDDEATTGIALGVAPFAGSFQPEGQLSDFDGEDANGTWTLEVTSWGWAFSTPYLNAWSLDFDLLTVNDTDGDGWVACGDCDDTDPASFPGAVEVCGDGLDQDCDGVDASGDSDGDGYSDVACGGDDCDDADPGISPAVDGDGDGSNVCEDCDDGNADNFPGNVDTCLDGLDQDCDGVDASGDSDGDGFIVVGCGGDDCDDTNPFVNPVVDWDGDGSPGCDDCDDFDPTRSPLAEETCGDGIDNDCDGEVDEADADGDGWDSVGCGGFDCDDDDPEVYPGVDVDGDGFEACYDCDDADADVNSGAAEVCADGIDNDCDGVDLVGDGDGDGFDAEPCGGTDCDDLDADVHPGAEEWCDGVDRDCDGQSTATDADGDGFFDATCGGADCDDADPGVSPDAVEACNGLDDDCDGVVPGDEADSDGDGAPACEDCDDEDDSASPGAAEVCDEVDNDCDGDVDEGLDGDGDGFAPTACGGEDCDDADPATNPDAEEVCGDAVDNNCDGDVDDGRCEERPGCGCETSAAPPSGGLALLLVLVPALRRRRRRGRAGVAG